MGKEKQGSNLVKELQVLLRNVGLVKKEKKKKERKRKRILGFGLVEVPFLFPLMSFVVILWKITIKFRLACLLVLIYQVNFLSSEFPAAIQFFPFCYPEKTSVN